MKKRNLLLLIIALGLIALSATLGGVYAYWQGSVSAPEKQTREVTVQIGEGADGVTTKINVTELANNTDQVLVPEGREDSSKVIDDKKNVSKVQFTAKVTWVAEKSNTTINGEKGTLNITATSHVEGLDDERAAELFKVTFSPESGSEIIGGKEVTVIITVTFANEPANKDEYQLVKAKNLTLNLTFNVI